MPFASFRQPSPALGLLAASLAPLGVSTRTIHAGLDLAALIGPETYDLIATWPAEDLLGDWLFAHHLREAPPAPEEYLAAVLAGGAPEHRVPFFGKPPLTEALREELLRVRELTDEFLAQCLHDVLDAGPLVVGFTSMVHQQTASLALARRVKEAAPGVTVVVGGPACHGEMGAEVLRSFGWVDAVATGEGETVLPALAAQALASAPPAPVPGLLWRGRALARDATPATAPATTGDPAARPVVDLDQLPEPAFDDYFRQLAAGPLAGSFTPRLPLETSRGCWWGERSRCAFCGQASAAMTYRAKSPQRALRELRHVTQRHPHLPVVVTDEILPPAYFDELVPALPAQIPNLQIVYLQMRPDCSREHLAALAAAGVRRVEAGVESLSTPVLRLMGKGTTMIANVQFLKWARELGIDVVWNLLWGLPGESELEYRHMADLVPLLTHLQPPNTVGSFRLDRFSPLFEQPEVAGIGRVRPYPAWSHVYGLPEDALGRLATSFAFDYEDRRPVSLYTLPLASRIAEWKEQHRASRLAFAAEGERLVVFEGRPGFEADECTMLDGDHRLLYLACAAARPDGALAADLAAATGRSVTAADVGELLGPLVDEGLMLREGRRYLSLALALPERPASSSARIRA